MGSRKTQDMGLVEIQFGKDQYHLQRDMVRWCEQNLGPGGYTGVDPYNHSWSWNSMFGSTFFHFKNERDATLFSLKWS
jgi:hypothetical protein